MSKCVRRTRRQGIREETGKTKLFRDITRRLPGFRSENHVNERTATFPSSRPESQRYIFQCESIVRRYRIEDHIHTGLDSEIYIGVQRMDSQKVVIKISEKSQEREGRRHEALLDDGTPVGVPRFYSYEVCEDSKKTFLVTERLGLSLYDILERSDNRQIRLKDVCIIAIKAIACLKYIHGKGVIHGDINPKNILVGRLDYRSEMFLIDFKSMQPWGHHGKRIPCEDARSRHRNSHYGSPRSCSWRILTRRDDMISLSYVVIVLLKGELPWMKIGEVRDSRRMDKMKEHVGNGGNTCADLPLEIVDFIKRVHHLEYSEEPDYIALTELFKACFRRIDEAHDDDYQWFPNLCITS